MNIKLILPSLPVLFRYAVWNNLHPQDFMLIFLWFARPIQWAMGECLMRNKYSILICPYI